MNTLDEETLLRDAADALRELGITVTGRDALLTLERDGERVQYEVEIKLAVSPNLIGTIVQRFGTKKAPRLLVSDYLTAPVAEALRKAGIQFVDTAGNAFVESKGLLIFVSGRRPARKHAPSRTLRVFRPSGLRITFALLSLRQMVQAPQRDLAHVAGVSLGSVSGALDGLRQLGFLAEVNGERKLMHRERLIDQWTEAYARLLAPELQIERFSSTQTGWWRRTNLTPYDAQWGGETAAALLQEDLVPELAMIYAAELPHRLIVDRRLKRDPNGLTVVRRRFWNFETPLKRRDVVPPLLVYADLIVSGDARSLSAAKQIRDEYLT